MPNDSTLQSLLFSWPEKRCSHCGETKPFTCFSPCGRYGDGYFCFCLQCMGDYNVDVKKRRFIEYVGIGVKWCARCEKILSQASFGLDKGREDGLFPYCRRCRVRDVERHDEKLRNRGLRRCAGCRTWLPVERFGSNAANPDSINYKCLECGVREANIRRTRKLGNGGTHTVHQWRELKARYDHRCLCCGKQEPEITLTQDHVIPLSRGGTDDIENIAPLCLRCNCIKGKKIIDFRSYPFKKGT